MLCSNLLLKFYLISVYLMNSGVFGFGYFWHISDTHVDQNYSRTGNTFHLCHPDVLPFPDNGLYGNFLCDSPEYLVNISVHAMKTFHPNPDFIIWTGDNLPHTDFNPDWAVTFVAIRNTTELLSSTFPNVTILPSIGNHDTFPPDQLLPNGPVYKGYLEDGGWSQLLTEEARLTFLQGGFYSHVIQPGLRVVSLNTILWYTPNTLTAEMVDPANQLLWLEGLLSSCSKSSEKVYIIGHVPPGFYNRVKYGARSDPTYHPQILITFLQILSKYSEIILGQLYGHYHLDMFQVFQYDTGTFKGSSLLASSVTPWHSQHQDNVSIPVNPSVRLLKYSETNFTLLDYDQFYLNLTKANAGGTKGNGTLYEPLYKFTEAYNVPDLSTESLVQVYENLKRDDLLYNTFFNFLTVAKESVSCDNFCKVSQLCSMSCSSLSEYKMCMKSAPVNSLICWPWIITFGVAILMIGLLILTVYWLLPSKPCKTLRQYKPLNQI